MRLRCLLEEYRAMYGLAAFRMASLDRRVPVAGATLAVSLASVAAMPQEATVIVLLGLPLALIWLLRTTINHARSFEDALRRIEQIEREINALVGRDTMTFQSSHPSRGRHAGGRTSRETIGTVVVIAVILLAGCGYMFASTAHAAPWGFASYGGFLTTVLGYMASVAMGLKRYEYVPRSGE
jgi:F0F1-type ATP synthase assembly protein I